MSQKSILRAVPQRLRRPVPYQELDHTADAGVIVHGASKEETLARLVLAYADLVSGGSRVRETTELTVDVEPGDLAAMAVDVLRELLFRHETERWIPESCEVAFFEPELGARVLIGAGAHDAALHSEGLVLKAVTLHEARFQADASGFVAQVVFDV